MFEKSGTKFKVEEFVEITLAGQDPFEAVVFLSVGDRLIDLLNDPRTFIPVKRMDNSTIIMAKSNIVSIVERNPFSNQAEAEDASSASQDLAPQADEDEFDHDEQTAASSEDSETKDEETKQKSQKRRRRRRKKPTEFDAYAVLKVSPDASIEEIRSAYKSRIKAVHPDSIAALDLDEDLIKSAIQTTQRVNYAYHTILKERRQTDTLNEQAEQDSGAAA